MHRGALPIHRLEGSRGAVAQIVLMGFQSERGCEVHGRGDLQIAFMHVYMVGR